MRGGLITYALTCGGTAELHNKEVTLTTSDVTGSQTAIFEYDPQNEPVTGTPPGPWDGYSLFTIDLSGVKDDIVDLQQRISDAETCRQQVIAVLQQYDPDYDPAEGECPASKVDDLYDDYYEDEQTIADLQEQIEECDQCKADVIAKLQEYDPDFDPQTCSDIPPEIDKIVDENKGVVVPDGVDPIPIIEELGVKTGVNTSLDGKKVTFEYVGRGYYPVSDNDYTPAQASEQISEYLAINGLYSAFQLAPEPTSVYTYRTWMYSVQIEGFPKYYSFNFASNNQTVPGDNVTGVIISDGRTAFIQTETVHGAVFTAASGKSWGTDSELKIY